ncbi:MAG: F0F1 ATP synthase subunit delta [Peptostreptococcaceae bacterium]|jgi:F-type H+-transporting ATPase subunit delta|nr:F0F1 ATP synthase subunit delta [Peptostreptococcaceae bacterium]
MAELVSARYATALFDVAVEGNKKKELMEELNNINFLFEENKSFMEIYKSPVISNSEKKDLIKKIFEGKVSDYMYNFLSVLVDKNRVSYISGIFNEFKKLYNDSENIAEAIAITAIKLSDEKLEKLKANLCKITNKTIILENQVDKEVIGGMLIKIGEQELDGTLKKRLNEIKENLREIKA